MIHFVMLTETDEEKTKVEELYIKYGQLMFYAANRILNDKYLMEIYIGEPLKGENEIESMITLTFKLFYRFKAEIRTRIP